MINYYASNAKDCFDDVVALLDDHYKELFDEGKLNPNFDAYKDLDEKGKIVVICCKKDNELIGYILFIIMNDLHNKEIIFASEDFYYLKPKYRKGRTGIEMFKFAEKYLKIQGIDKILVSTQVKHDNSKLFEYLGYKNAEKIYIKNIRQ